MRVYASALWYPNRRGVDANPCNGLYARCVRLRRNFGPTQGQTKQDLDASIPNLSGYDTETRLTMQLACGSEKVNGPVPYGACLNRQIASLKGSPSIPNPTNGGTAVHSTNGSGTDVAPQVKDGWVQVSEDLSFRPDSIKLGDKEISVLMQLKTPDDQLHLSIVGVPYKVCSQGYGKIRFYDLSHVFQADADAALNGDSHSSYVATMLCAVKSEATKPK